MIEPGVIFAGDYRVVRTLATGGMGSVLVVEQRSTQKLRALKIMQPHLLQNEDLRKRFVQEARIGARIESEHIVEVHAAGIDPMTGYPYLVMELLEGEDLAHRLEKHGAVSVTELLLIFSQLTHALNAAHAAGVVHRDLKPENIFLAQSKRADVAITVKILDFGIAKLVAEGTVATGAMGSPLWLAPEQTEPGPVSPAADIWSLGLIAFNALTNAYFWSSTDGTPTVSQLLREIVLAPIARASDRARMIGRTVPNGFDDWFARCVARDPRSRFSSVREMLDAMRRAFGGDEALAATVAGAMSAPPFSAAPPIGSSPPRPMSLPTRAISSPPPTATPPPVSATRPPEQRQNPLLFAVIALLAIFVVGMLAIGGWFAYSQRRAAAANDSREERLAASALAPAPVSSSAALDPGAASLPFEAPVIASASAAPSASATPATPASTSKPAAAITPDPATTKATSAPATPHKPALEKEGTLPDGAVELVLRANVSRTRACYTDAIQRDPTIHGKIIVRYWITADGSVRKVVDNGSTIHDDAMTSCVFGVLYSLKYPKPVGGDVIVDVPFSYEQRHVASDAAAP